MPETPQRASEYNSGHLDRVHSTCLYIATKLGDLMEHDIVIIGGVVPSLLITQTSLPSGVAAHVGTMDLDVGLHLALLDDSRYSAVTERLRSAGFVPDTTENGSVTRQRWRIGNGDSAVTIDFLIPPSRDTDRGGGIRNLEGDFAAFIIPGLNLAFRDRVRKTISGQTIIHNETATRDIHIAGPGAFVVLKALAFRGRGQAKDAYDLDFVVRNYGNGASDVAACLRPLLDDGKAQEAIRILRADFLDHNAIGPRRVADFLFNRPDDELQADVVGGIAALLHAIDHATGDNNPGDVR